MKKIAKYLVAIILAFGLVFAYTQKTRADSGWDGSYSSGGNSSWSGGGGYSSSSSSSWSSSGGGFHYSSGNSSSSSSGSIEVSDIPPYLIITIFVTFIFIIYISNSRIHKQTLYPMRNAKKSRPYDVAMSADEIKKVLKDFDYTSFKNLVFEKYKTIQIAWMDFDYDTLRKNTTDELYNMYHSQLLALKVKRQKNIMKDFEYLNFRVVELEHNESEVSLKVFASISCIDYVEDENHRVVRGSDYQKVIYNYLMTFTKGTSSKENKCPNCNAPLENVQSSVCPYCDSTIISSNHDWVLSKKEMVSQRRG